MQRVPERRSIHPRPGLSKRRDIWKRRVLITLAVLGLSACASDPAEVGITGPYPEGIAPVTLTRAQPRAEASDDTPGVRVDTADRITPGIRSRGSASPARRYYGYDH